MKSKSRGIAAIARNVSVWISRHKLLSLVLSLSILTNLSLTIFNGIKVCEGGRCGLYIGNLHYHDFFWHFALATTAFRTYPFTLPIFEGSVLQGYNFLIDILLFLFTKIGIPVLFSYFIVLPILYLVLVSYLGYVYLKNRKNDPIFIASGMFFVFFGSSFSYILSLYHFHTWKSFMYAQAMQSGRALLNMPYALSLPVLLYVMIILQKDKLSFTKKLVLGLMVFIMFGLKFYGGVVLLVILLGNRFFVWMKKVNIGIVFELMIYGGGVILAYLLFYRTGSFSNSFPFAFSPFSIAHPLIEEKDMFYMPSLVLARYFLVGTKAFSPRLLAIELLTAAIFLLYNLGSRIIGIFYLFVIAAKKRVSRNDATMLISILVSVVVTLLFVQKREWWNIIQFMGYALFLMNFFAGEVLYRLLKSKNKILLIVGIIVVLATLPSNLEQITFAAERHVSIVQEELQALDFLKTQPKGVVVVLPMEETSYVAAFSQKQVYFADKTQLYLLGIDYEKRMTDIKNAQTPAFDTSKVKYVYLRTSTETDSCSFAHPQYREVFRNRAAAVFVRK